MSNRLSGKLALVTGAASGIGRRIAQEFYRQGARIAVADKNVHGLIPLTEDPNEDVLKLKLDVTSPTDWSSAIEQIQDSMEYLDVLVNSAGIAVQSDNIETISKQRFDHVLNVNVGGSLLGCQQVIPLMRKHGGSIINLGSIRSHCASANTLAYSTSKHAVLGLTRSIALYCAEFNPAIRVNTICPGAIQSEMQEAWLSNANNPIDEQLRIVGEYPMGRLGTTQEVALAAVYLASDESRFTTATHLNIDGGFTA